VIAQIDGTPRGVTFCVPLYGRGRGRILPTVCFVRLRVRVAMEQKTGLAPLAVCVESRRRGASGGDKERRHSEPSADLQP
jgi:hypothetical protein